MCFTWIYILLFVILIVSIAFHERKEKFETLDYRVDATHWRPPDNSCMRLLEAKKWFDPKDDSAMAKNRKNVIADLDVARVRQSQHSSFAYPNIDACTFGNDVLNMYYNAKGRTTIDPQTCDMVGLTSDNTLVHHKLEKVESNVFPSGCMINLEDYNKQSFERLIDDAYQLKMYPELKEKKEYRQALITLAQKNDELKSKYDTLEAMNKKYAMQLDQKSSCTEDTSLGNDQISGTCRDVYTDWNENGGWKYNYLDRHNVQCSPSEVVSKFQLESNPKGKIRYKYRCCSIDTSPVAKKAKETATPSSTAFQNALVWDTHALMQQNVQCPSDNKGTGMLQQFRLEPQYISNVAANARYNYRCSSYAPSGLIGKTIKTECRNVKTPSRPASKTLDSLRSHAVGCQDGEGISNFVLKTNGNQFYYDYSCCRPRIVNE